MSRSMQQGTPTTLLLPAVQSPSNFVSTYSLLPLGETAADQTFRASTSPEVHAKQRANAWLRGGCKNLHAAEKGASLEALTRSKLHDF